MWGWGEICDLVSYGGGVRVRWHGCVLGGWLVVVLDLLLEGPLLLGHAGGGVSDVFAVVFVLGGAVESDAVAGGVCCVTGEVAADVGDPEGEG